jgi:superfamily II DNA or RNA helicase
VQHQPALPGWKQLLERIGRGSAGQATGDAGNASDWPADRQVVYIIDIPASLEARTLVVRLSCRDRKVTGEWAGPKTRGITFPGIEQLPDPADQQIVALLAGAKEFYPTYEPRFEVPERLQALVVRLIGQSDRALIRDDGGDEKMRPLAWDDGPPWQFWLEARADNAAQQYLFVGSLRRGEERRPLSSVLLASGGGVVLLGDRAALLDDQGAGHWIAPLRQQGVMRVPMAQIDPFLGEVLRLERLPRMELPDELRIQSVNVTPRPQLRVHSPTGSGQADRLPAELSFEYSGVVVPWAEPRSMIFQAEGRRLVMRDRRFETAAIDRLLGLGARRGDGSQADFQLHQRNFGRIIRELVTENWSVEADGRLYRGVRDMSLSVSSGIDWFELRGDVEFEGGRARLPDLLMAIRRGENTVRLNDGSYGMLPDSWLKKYGLLASLGDRDGDFIRFSQSQIGLLDALLAIHGQATCDEAFERARQALHNFDGIAPVDAAPTFVGTLRPYQREGLGWFEFLERFGFGGCLADDMGLGKTIQVLALLDARRARREAAAGPSLIVVPKSLVFNWHQEAARFTPGLRLLDHTGMDRVRGTDHLSDYDAIITTYGTLRRDVEFLKDAEFEYVILDEAQAIKNPGSESAKALRLVRGKHRLTLSGTPVQNHLGDLWSLFEFLNPGMLGSASVFTGSGSTLRNPDPETRGMLSRALRPFILRRTKEQVASDLPEKLEQTIYCELEGEQRQLYDELRIYYRQSLLEQIDRFGMGKSKMQVLEALLRLRQAALHPGLIDKARCAETSAKLEMLLPQLDEVIDEGHKALVFSQFTSMLAIVRDRLDRQNITYEYLDGKTRDREERVMRFQNDPDCKLFLVSLKAGGLGLNLTAADYVFLLDPWWNPAIEQQAIDRAHRIGQTRRVYACRLIAKDTVEEKVLALQQTKRDLADAIITSDNSVMRTLGREDLDLLLS